MEPGHEDREYEETVGTLALFAQPQWSPVMKTGNTRCFPAFRRRFEGASMEPGHEDREYPGSRIFRGLRRNCLNGARS